MFASNLMRALVTGVTEASVNFSVIVTWPTRGGCGETSWASVRSDDESPWCLQPCTSAIQTQRATSELRLKNTGYAAMVCNGSRRNEQVHAALSSALGGNMW